MANEILNLRAQARDQQHYKAIQQCRASGLSIREWCRQNGVGESTFYKWQRTLREKMVAQSESIPALVPISTKDNASPETSDPECPICICFHGADIKIKNSASPDLIHAVLKSL